MDVNNFFQAKKKLNWLDDSQVQTFQTLLTLCEKYECQKKSLTLLPKMKAKEKRKERENRRLNLLGKKRG